MGQTPERVDSGDEKEVEGGGGGRTGEPDIREYNSSTRQDGEGGGGVYQREDTCIVFQLV